MTIAENKLIDECMTCGAREGLHWTSHYIGGHGFIRSRECVDELSCYGRLWNGDKPKNLYRINDSTQIFETI